MASKVDKAIAALGEAKAERAKAESNLARAQTNLHKAADALEEAKGRELERERELDETVNQRVTEGAEA